MNLGSHMIVVMAALQISCGTSQHAVPSHDTTVAKAEDLARLVLILKEAHPGQVRHDWRSVEDVLPALSNAPRIVLASGRDCYAELLECMRECMSRPLPRGFGHTTQGRGKGGKEEYCNKRCMRPYRDCMDLQDLKPREFSSGEAATDWLKRHHQSILVGSVFVIAGVAFVVASAGAGVLILIPATLMASADVSTQAPMAVAP
jgi:hypothetical protein